MCEPLTALPSLEGKSIVIGVAEGIAMLHARYIAEHMGMRVLEVGMTTPCAVQTIARLKPDVALLYQHSAGKRCAWCAYRALRALSDCAVVIACADCERPPDLPLGQGVERVSMPFDRASLARAIARAIAGFERKAP